MNKLYILFDMLTTLLAFGWPAGRNCSLWTGSPPFLFRGLVLLIFFFGLTSLTYADNTTFAPSFTCPSGADLDLGSNPTSIPDQAAIEALVLPTIVDNDGCGLDALVVVVATPITNGCVVTQLSLIHI